MIIMDGKKPVRLDASELRKRIAGFAKLHLDIGTGSGRYLLARVLREQETFFIGIDPVASSMAEGAIKARKLLRQATCQNLLFVVAAIEEPPPELVGLATSLSVLLPWGSLRDGLCTANATMLQKIRSLGSTGCSFYCILGYDDQREEGERQRRDLPSLSKEYFTSLQPAYREAGIAVTHISSLGNQELKQLASDWARRLAHGIPRTMYCLEGHFLPLHS
ncbi:MAG: hypothetical protein FWF06_05390 [Symbiobacteriaceae bacterium]|nr:hypothetical protein [Symbiobacteriaceae bacterium]